MFGRDCENLGEFALSLLLLRIMPLLLSWLRLALLSLTSYSEVIRFSSLKYMFLVAIDWFGRIVEVGD